MHLLTAKEVAARLGYSVQTLAIWRSRNPGRLPFVRIGRTIRYRPEAVEQFISEHENTGGGTN
jgi:excisionase family DNA binding protein